MESFNFSCRRRFLAGLVAGGLSATLPGRLAVAAIGAPLPAERRFVLVLLRGGLDGLSLCPAWGDPYFDRARAGIAIPPPGEAGGALALDGFFALHPTLPRLHERWRAGELVLLHAHCSPYRQRSHFDAQNVLEHGGTAPYALAEGWLNRTLDVLRVPAGRGAASRVAPAMAFGGALPLVMRGSASAASWSPSLLPSPEEDLLDRIGRLYGDDEPLAAAFGAARVADELTREVTEAAPGGRRGGFEALARSAGRMLAARDGPRIATLEAGGWDTHSHQERSGGSLHRHYRALDGALEALRTELGSHWKNTAVLVLTEFGRTVAMNGSAGTDHGTGGAGLLVGGAVRGGRVIADWPGLSPGSLYQGRDLRATLDTRAIIKGVLQEHLQVPNEALARVVFPNSQAIRPVNGLIRADAT